MAAFIDFQVRPKCWNLIDSYGMICVGCGCCSNDKQMRYKARIKTLEAWLEEQYNFDMWDDEYGLLEIQEKNVKSNIRSFKRMLRYYKGKLKEMEVNGDDRQGECYQGARNRLGCVQSHGA